MTRPTWGQYFMDIAKTAAARSSCERLAVGAVIVDPKHSSILSVGYNGAVRGQPSCMEVGCLIDTHRNEKGELFSHCSRAVHAEQNALFNAAARGVAVDGAVCYVTAQPCWFCARGLHQSGVRSVFYGAAYGARHPLLEDLLKSGDFQLNEYLERRHEPVGDTAPV